MKRWIRRLSALLLCALLTLPALPRAQGATVYFTALNDTLLTLSEVMPTLYNGVLYVPYTVFTPRETGVDLGVTATYSTMKNRVMLFSSQHQLTFDLAEDATYDLDGNSYSGRAITRNSMVYLPIAQVCAVFTELKYTVNYTEFGYLVRLKNSKVILSDSAFINAAENPMRNALSRYEAEHPAETPPPAETSPTPTVTPTPTPGVGSGRAVYLAFGPGSAAEPEALLSALDGWECRGLFFFTADELGAEGDRVRRLLGEGHFVGLYTGAEELSAARTELEAARKKLAAAAHCRAAAVLAPNLSEADAAALEAEGWVCWQTTVDGTALEGAARECAEAVRKQMAGEEHTRNYILLDARYGPVLNGLLEDVRREEYRLRSALPTEL